MSEGEVISGAELSSRIRLICAEDEVDCAVAFWGGFIRDDLFPRWKEQKVRIICDIAMGCNSQESLKCYGAPDNPNLTVLDGLHAKVFLSRAGAIVGSANASANGIGTTARRAANLEAGVFFPQGSAGWDAAKRFFDECLEDQSTLPLDQSQLDRARLRARDPGPEIGQAGTKARSVLDLVRSYPDAFSDTLFFSEDEEIDPDDRRKLEKIYRAAEKAKSFEPSEREFIIVYPKEDIPFLAPNIALYWLGSGKGLSGYTDVVYVLDGKQLALFGKRSWPRFWKGRGLSRPKGKDAFKDDHARVQEIEGGTWIMTASQIVDALRVRDQEQTL